MNYEKLITKHVQKLVPYQSARRIGGHGHSLFSSCLLPQVRSHRQPKDPTKGSAGGMKEQTERLSVR